MATIEFKQVTKHYSGDAPAVRDFNLSVTDGEFLVLVGPSGCGKSTLLRLLAGLEDVTTGEVCIGDRLVNSLAPQQRDVAMVFQNYALYPHKTVRNNLAFPLQMAGWTRERIQARVAEAARLLELESLLERKPGQLSGGQRQRVAMGRALVREPAVFLMDEPLSNLDAQLRVQMRREITALQRRLRTTTIYVTHDQVEAMTMGDRLAVLNAGELQQVGTPRELYDRPANVFVATFIGSPRMNLIESQLVSSSAGSIDFNLGTSVLPLPARLGQCIPGDASISGRRFKVGIRPEAFFRTTRASGTAQFEARVIAVESLGHEQIVYLDAGINLLSGAGKPLGDSRETGGTIVARLPASEKVESGNRITLDVKPHGIHLFDEHGIAVGSREVGKAQHGA